MILHPAIQVSTNHGIICYRAAYEIQGEYVNGNSRNYLIRSAWVAGPWRTTKGEADEDMRHLTP